MKLDFEELKAAAPLDQVAIFLGLELKREKQTFRSGCPACKTTNPRAIVITPATGQWYCFGSRVGGKTPVNFACHIRGLDPKTQAREAAQLLADHFLSPPQGIETVPTKPEAAAQAATPPGIGNVASYLVYDHDTVKALGLDEPTARALGIGFAPKGMMSGRVAIPIRAQDGSPICYVGYSAGKDPQLKLGKINLHV